MNSLEAKNKYCLEIGKNCLADGCMMWVVTEQLKPITEKLADKIIVDTYGDPENKNIGIALIIENGKCIKRRTRVKPMFEVLEETEIQWSKLIEQSVKARRLPTIFESEHEKKVIHYNSETQLWMERIEPIKQNKGYCAKYKKDFGI